MKTCGNCEWWKRSDLKAPSTKVMEVDLGYCEPMHEECSGFWKGLTAEDYSCGEHAPKEALS